MTEIVLATDTSTKIASVAVVRVENGKPALMAQVSMEGGTRHSEMLLPCIDRALTAAGVHIGEVSLFAAASGPGSFTGIRINIAVVKGLAFELDEKSERRNTVGVSSLDSLAFNLYGFRLPEAWQSRRVIAMPVIDARRRQVYNAVYTLTDGDLCKITDDRIITTEALGSEISRIYGECDIIFIGDAAHMCYNEINCGRIRLPEQMNMPSGYSLACAAVHMYGDARRVRAAQLLPCYLIKTEAERNLGE